MRFMEDVEVYWNKPQNRKHTEMYDANTLLCCISKQSRVSTLKYITKLGRKGEVGEESS